MALEDFPEGKYEVIKTVIVSPCPICKASNPVEHEIWFHGAVSFFLCLNCDTLFGQSPSGEFVESRYYYEDLSERRPR